MPATKVPRNAATPIPSGPPLALPDGISQDIEPSRLLLDPQNLRLLERVGDDFQKIATKLIGQRSVQDKLSQIILGDDLFEINSLLISIANNGFLKHERLIVAPYDGKSFLVLEGNRRLTAVRHLLAEKSNSPKGISESVLASMNTLPCFVLEGEPIGDSAVRLNAYRRAAEIYIGMRHLMGARSWEPASRYEFQAKLINEEKWTPAQVAERFGRKKNEVLRDLKAQSLYHDFRAFEKRSNIQHALTYNAFAESARAPSIMKWLGWSNDQMRIKHKDREEALFHYLTSRLRARKQVRLDDEEEDRPEESAESLVRRLREMIKLDDPSIQDAIVDRDFDAADILFEERREGEFAKRIATYVRGLRRATAEDLLRNPKECRLRLSELADQAKKTLAMLEAVTAK